MIDKYVFAALSISASLFNAANYTRAILFGKIKPHVFSWFVWFLTMGIAAAAQYADHAGIGALPTAVATFNCFLFTIFALLHGEKSITRGDWMTFLGALSAIPLWAATGNPLYAVILVTLIDGLGFYPTFRKSWNKPQQEQVTVFVVAAFVSLMTCLAVENQSFITLLYPATLFALEVALVIMLLWRRRILERA
jgi:hypothetical protein